MGTTLKGSKALIARHLQVAPELRSLVLVHSEAHERHLHRGPLQQHRLGLELPRLRVEARHPGFKHQVYLLGDARKDHTCDGRMTGHDGGEGDSGRLVGAAPT